MPMYSLERKVGNVDSERRVKFCDMKLNIFIAHIVGRTGGHNDSHQKGIVCSRFRSWEHQNTIRY